MTSSPKAVPAEDAPIKLHADEMNTKQFNKFIGVVVLLLGTIFLLASGFPPAHLMRNRPPADCNNSVYSSLGIACAPFSLDQNPVVGIDVDELGSSNQFITIQLTPYEKNSKHDSDIDAKIEISVFTIQPDNTSTLLIPAETRDITFDCSPPRNADCEPENIFTLSNLEDKHYYFVLKFVNADQLKDSFTGFVYTTITLDLVYRTFVFGVKLIFLILSVVGYFIYSSKVSNFKKEFYCQEQKSLERLLPLLIVINEPITSHILGGTIYSCIIITLFTIFAALLIQLWFIIADDLAGSDSSLLDKVSPQVQIYTLLYLITVWLTYVTLHSNEVDDPSFSFITEPGFLSNLFKLILYGVIILGFVWYVWRTVRIIQRINTSQDREIYFFWFSFFFFICHLYLVARGGLDPFNHHDAKSVVFSGTSTLYVLSLCYLYQPTPEGIELAIRKKTIYNPAVKNMYKDLEDSPERKPKPSVSNQQGIQLSNQGVKGGEPQYQEQVNTAERGLNEPKYPYEHRSEDEL